MIQHPNNTGDAEIDWSLTIREGCRREQLRRWVELPLERIVAAQEEMAELTRRFSEMRARGEFYRTSTGNAVAQESAGDYSPKNDKKGES
jgi:hypothetical protein